MVQIKESEKAGQLSKEMRLALHPEHGQAEVAALEKENKRAELRLSELRATQQRLQTDLSNAIAKRETYVIKVWPHLLEAHHQLYLTVPLELASACLMLQQLCTHLSKSNTSSEL